MKDELLSLADKVEELFDRITKKDAIPIVDSQELHMFLSDRFPLCEPRSVSKITEDVNSMLSRWTLQTNHPRHFGLYQPSVRSIGVIADALAAAYNPQLGAWWFSPAANEIERHCLAFISRKFGLVPDEVFSCFTSGTSESTTSAVLCGLTKQFPCFRQEGLFGISRRPRLYVSSEAHDSIQKIAHQTGLGRSSISRVSTDSCQRMDIDMLARQVFEDRKSGNEPFLVVATAGTTAVGAIDPLAELLTYCKAENLWLHVDAAWGGGIVFSKVKKSLLAGIENVDSISWDPHKSLPVPTGAGYFSCRHLDTVKQTFGVDTSYVPDELEGHPDLYKLGLQWSRRFIGLKVFMTIAELGEEGLAAMVEHQFEMGEYLLQRLKAKGWAIVNHSPLPVICFTPPESRCSAEEVLNRIIQHGKCWISKVCLGDGRTALRACITSFRTRKEDIDFLMDELESSMG